MRIDGLQKLTLLDFPERTACTVFSGGCNFRCPFCHNASLVTNVQRCPNFSEDEVLSFLKRRKGLIDGVCFTGGEPLLQSDIGDFMKKVRDMGYAVKLDTNGSFPERFIALVENKLVDYVAMDIKNSPNKYTKTVGIENLNIDNICKSVEFLKKNTVDYEFRTTVVKNIHTLEDIVDIGKWISGAKAYFLQSYKNSGDVIDSTGLESFNPEEMRLMLDSILQYVPSAQLRGV